MRLGIEIVDVMKIIKNNLLTFLIACAVSTIAHGQNLISLMRQDGTMFSAMAYKPANNECKGVAIISHGAGGSEQGYAYLGTGLSDLGYLAVVPRHKESGRLALQAKTNGKSIRDGLAALITDANAYQTRFMDIAAVKTWAQNVCESKESVLIGHSMGAATVMMQAGARNNLNLALTASFGAYIAISPQGVGMIFPENAWSEIEQPVLMLTGTQDREIDGHSWETRTTPFKNMPSGCKWLGVIDGATHMNFAGNGFSKKTETLTIQVIRDFLKAKQTGECQSVNQLTGMTLTVK